MSYKCGAKTKNGKKCKRKVSSPRGRCVQHGGGPGRPPDNIETNGTAFVAGNKLANLYHPRSNKKGKKGTSLTEALALHTQAVKEEGSLISSLEHEITMVRSIISETFRELDLLTESNQESEFGRREWLRGKAVEHAEKLAIIIEKHHKIQYGELHTIRVESVDKILLIMQDSMLRNIPDPEIAEKVVGDFKKIVARETIR